MHVVHDRPKNFYSNNKHTDCESRNEILFCTIGQGRPTNIFAGENILARSKQCVQIKTMRADQSIKVTVGPQLSVGADCVHASNVKWFVFVSKVFPDVRTDL